MMPKTKALIILLIITPLIGYLEWGTDMSMFLIEGEIDVVKKLVSDFGSAAHPFTLLPLAGQLLLLMSLFQKQPKRLLIYLGMAFIAVLLVLMFAIGIMSWNWKILGSSLPFLIACVLMIIHLRGLKKNG